MLEGSSRDIAGAGKRPWVLFKMGRSECLWASDQGKSEDAEKCAVWHLQSGAAPGHGN